jgi:hypothetical protein
MYRFFPLGGAGLVLGGVFADKLGTTVWRLYWVAVAVLLIRHAAVLWRRLQLVRLAAGLIIFAATCASFAVLGANRREVNSVMASYWIWFAAALIAMVGLMLWEGRHSPEKLGFLKTSSAGDWFTLRNIPDLRSHAPD